MRLISFYHDTILSRVALKNNPKAPSLFNRYTKAILKRSTIYQRIALILVWIQSFEVVAEMLALKRFGVELQSRLVVLVELAK